MGSAVKRIVVPILILLVHGSSFGASCRLFLKSQPQSKAVTIASHFIAANARFPLIEVASEYILIGAVLSRQVSIKEIENFLSGKNPRAVTKLTIAQQRLHRAYGIKEISEENMRIFLKDNVLVNFRRTLNHTMLILTGRTSDMPDVKNNYRLFNELVSNVKSSKISQEIGESILEAVLDKGLFKKAKLYQRQISELISQNKWEDLSMQREDMKEIIVTVVAQRIEQVQSSLGEAEVLMKWHQIKKERSRLIGRNLDRI